MNTRTTAPDSLIAGINDTSFELLRKLDDLGSGNLFVSPFSIYTALAVAANGARGTTLCEMVSALRLSGVEMAATNNALSKLLEHFRSSSSEVSLEVANALFVHARCPLSPEFLALARNQFSTTVDNFKPGEEAKQVNDWVEANTTGRIRQIVERLPADIALVIVNAVFFRSAWDAEFSHLLTKPAPFHLKRNEEIVVRYMNQTSGYHYCKTNELELIRLPYKSPSRWEMVVILPAETASVESVVARLNQDEWTKLVTSCDFMRIELSMPKYSIEFSKSLKQPLMALGMKTAFSAGQADFSGIADIPTEPLYIGDVLHKTFLQVDEKGTEAAAATVVQMGYGSASGVFPPQVAVKIDRPFLVAIRDKESKTILFLGAVRDPQK